MGGRNSCVSDTLGVHRIANGYVYINSIHVTNADEIARQSIVFKERVSYTLKNWESLYSQWEDKVKRAFFDRRFGGKGSIRVLARTIQKPLLVMHNRWQAKEDRHFLITLIFY